MVWAVQRQETEMMKRVLVIEDDKDIVELVRYNLEKDGFQVRELRRRRNRARANPEGAARSAGSRPDAAETFRP